MLKIDLHINKYRFDLRSMDPSGPEDEEGIRRAADMVHSLIAEEVAAGISTKRIVLGGFSQGGALAMYSALTFPEPLAGVLVLSAWLPMHQKFPAVCIECVCNMFTVSCLISCTFLRKQEETETPRYYSVTVIATR